MFSDKKPDKTEAKALRKELVDIIASTIVEMLVKGEHGAANSPDKAPNSLSEGLGDLQPPFPQEKSP